MDRNDSEDEEVQANGSLDTEIKSIAKMQEVLNCVETVHRFLEFSADKSIFDQIYELELHGKNTKEETQKKLRDYIFK